MLRAVVDVSERMKNERVVESTDANFKCTLDQANYKDGKWLRNGKEIKVDRTKYSPSVEGCTQRLRVHDVNRDDAGTYTYITGSGSRSDATLEVTPVHITEPLRDVTDTETNTVQLRVVLSHPGLKGSWHKDGEIVKVR